MFKAAASELFGFRWWSVVWVAVAAVAGTGAAADDPGELAREIQQQSGIRAGLIVHLNCGDGRLTAALYDGADCVVQGLDRDPHAVDRARRHIRQLGIYGPVSIKLWDSNRLPYVDNLVNLLVAEDLGGVSLDEAMRVLAPGGVLLTRRGSTWQRHVKPVPENTDEWTHYLHDASGNAVAHDQVVGPPCHVQWIAGPRHTRSHEHTPSVNALVSAGGRIFYIVDEAPVASILRPPAWHVVARDAYNGVLLWKRAFSGWFPHIVNWGQTPPQLQRRIVATGRRVYVTLGLHAPLAALDAATGQTLQVYENTEGTDEIVLHRGTLLLAIRQVTAERKQELARLAGLSRLEKSPLYARETAEPFVKRFRTVENSAPRVIRAIDAGSGRVLWEKRGAAARGLRPLSLCAGGDRAFYQVGSDIVCVDLATGQPRWSVPAPAPLRLVYEDKVICADGRSVNVLSAATGQTQWSEPASLVSIRDVFVAGGSLWLGGFKPCPGKRGPAWGPYFATKRDLATGRILMHVEPENPGHHHRCYLNKATDRYILAGRRGVEFIDLETGDVLWHSWVRGVCRYGIMPCNGLLYAPPHACGCYIAAKLTGFYALAPQRPAPHGNQPEPRLEHGPAFGQPRDGQAAAVDPASDWPTYRHDAHRSGATSCQVPPALKRRWLVEVGGRITSPTVGLGKVFVADTERHEVVALDADSGRPAWRFVAEGRVDSPPTLAGGRAVFGSYDGSVYSLRCSDGALAWRLCAAGQPEQVIVRQQLEAAKPVHGSVLVQDGVAYLTAGRSSYLDGGIDVYRVDTQTGKILSRATLYSPDPETGRQPPQYGPAEMPGQLSDILSGDDRFVYLRDTVLDRQGRPQKETRPHLFTLTGFLDDTWPHRSYWIFGTRCSLSTGCSGRDRNLIYGRLLAVGEGAVYGYGRANVHWSNQLQDGPYRLFAVEPEPRNVLWSKAVPCEVRAMVLAGKVLFAAGPPAGTRHGLKKAGDHAMLLAFSAADGSQLAQYTLDCPPVLDGMAAARGRLYIALEDGRLLCMEPDSVPAE